MTTSRKPSLTLVRKRLKECQFDPRATGPMKIIASMDDEGYYERRAQILIEEARAIRLSTCSPEYKDYMTQAIQLLILASL